MTLSQLRVLLAVADQGGFTLAAEQIGMSQPAVSRSITALEAELGTPLLTRRRDGVRLTEAGRRALGHAREAVRHFDLLRTEVAAIAGQVTGTLRLASLPSATGTLLASPLRSFADRYPQVRVRLFEGSEQEVRDWLERGAADIGVISLPAPDLQTVTLDTHAMVAVVPADHELADRATLSFEAMAGQPFILSTAGCEPLITAAARRAGVRLDIAFEASHLSAILQMVGTGLGISVVPALGLPTDLSTVAIRPLDQAPSRTLAVGLTPVGATAAARAFLDHVAGFAGPPSGRPRALGASPETTPAKQHAS